MKIVSSILKGLEDSLIAFACYGDDEFLGFHADTWGSLTKNWAKIYTNTPSQLETMRNNFQHHIKEKLVESNYKVIEYRIIPYIGEKYSSNDMNNWLTNLPKSVATISYENNTKSEVIS